MLFFSQPKHMLWMLKCTDGKFIGKNLQYNSENFWLPKPVLLVENHMSCVMWFPTMWYFEKCRLRLACVASF